MSIKIAPELPPNAGSSTFTQVHKNEKNNINHGRFVKFAGIGP